MFMFFIIAALLIWIGSAYLTHCNPWPIWIYQYILRREIALVSDSWEPYRYKVVIRKHPLDGQQYGYRYHLTNVGKVWLYENGKADFCGPATWSKL